MTNNKQQTAVEMMWNEIDNLFPYKDSVEAQKFCAILDKYKEMEKERMIKFCRDWFISREMNIKEYYKQTYGGGEQ